MVPKGGTPAEKPQLALRPTGKSEVEQFPKESVFVEGSQRSLRLGLRFTGRRSIGQGGEGCQSGLELSRGKALIIIVSIIHDPTEGSPMGEHVQRIPKPGVEPLRIPADPFRENSAIQDGGRRDDVTAGHGF